MNGKFRVWGPKYNSWDRPSEQKYMQYGGYFIDNDGTLHHSGGYNEPYVATENHIVQFFTGLQDKNGKDIYEGDILKSDFDSLYQVVYGIRGAYDCIGRDLYGFGMQSVLNNEISDNFDDCEIICNIYENPELLENK